MLREFLQVGYAAFFEIEFYVGQQFEYREARLFRDAVIAVS